MSGKNGMAGEFFVLYAAPASRRPTSVIRCPPYARASATSPQTAAWTRRASTGPKQRPELPTCSSIGVWHSADDGAAQMEAKGLVGRPGNEA
jgi:hypothetical protein